MSEPTVIRTINEFRSALLAREAGQMRAMARRWLEVEQALEGRIDALALEIARLREQGQPVNQWRLLQLGRYQELLAQTRREVLAYVDYADGLISESQRAHAALGAANAADVLYTIYREAGGVPVSFNLLPVEAIESMTDLTAGGPLRALLEQAWSDAVEGLTNNLVNAIAQGDNPRTTARAMRNGLADGLERCLVIARTEQLRAYREATRQQYIWSGVVKGYRRICARQMRTCLACLLSDGQFYTLEMPFEDHPNGRCSSLPVIEGLPPVQYTSGKAWFEGLSAGQQRQLMGKKLHEAWQGGQVSLGDLVRTHTDPTWGNHPRLATLTELGLK